MKSSILKTTVLSIGLLLGTSILASNAAEVSVGGVTATVGGSNGGLTGTANTGNVGATANVGGGAGNVANANVGFGNQAADVAIGSGSGPLATVDQNGNPVGGPSGSSAQINLGGLLGSLPGGGIGGASGAGGGSGNAISPARARTILTSLSSEDQAALRVRCKNVLKAPAGYTRDVVSICSVLRGI